ncbi:REP-associated tyrosine transposase [Luteimonas salinilitoris]|uniref:Transposase n=1 Tax=Luteimonas salinilitoris TaxID=3237697 RepID=A0ABV4HS69_9GAMM
MPKAGGVGNSYWITSLAPISAPAASGDAAAMASPRLLKGRISRVGDFYVVTTVTERRRELFRSGKLADVVVGELQLCAEEGALISLAWVVMPDHLHWLLQLQQSSLSRCMQAFKSRSARAINAVGASQGSVWQPGFYDHRLRDERDLDRQARYLIANPIRSGLVSDIDAYPYWGCRWISRAADL